MNAIDETKVNYQDQDAGVIHATYQVFVKADPTFTLNEVVGHS